MAVDSVFHALAAQVRALDVPMPRERRGCSACLVRNATPPRPDLAALRFQARGTATASAWSRATSAWTCATSTVDLRNKRAERRQQARGTAQQVHGLAPSVPRSCATSVRD